MARVTIEDCLKKVDNRFMLVHLGSKRVIQLRKGATPLVDAPKNKEVVLALREIAAGAVDLDSVSHIEHDELVSEALPEETAKESEDETASEEVQQKMQKEEQPSADEPGVKEEVEKE